MIARYFLCWLWGALLTSGWWATCLWGGVPVGPSSFPVVGVLTGIVSLVTLILVFLELIDSAKRGA